MVQAIVSTGALMAHGLSEAVGLVHYRHDPRDVGRGAVREGLQPRLRHAGDGGEPQLRGGVHLPRARRAEGPGPGQRDHLPRAGQGAGRRRPDRACCAAPTRRACRCTCPPSPTPSWASTSAPGPCATPSRPARPRTRRPSTCCRRYNPYLDLNSFARFCLGAKRLGIFTIGGGVPRNWAQEVGPYVDIANHRLGVDFKAPRYQYAVRICPEPTHWGGLSGCTYSEGVSWGKFVPARRGRPLRRGVRRRDHGVAAADQGGAGGDRESVVACGRPDAAHDLPVLHLGLAAARPDIAVPWPALTLAIAPLLPWPAAGQAPLGSEFLINEQTAGFQDVPSVALDAGRLRRGLEWRGQRRHAMRRDVSPRRQRASGPRRRNSGSTRTPRSVPAGDGLPVGRRRPRRPLRGGRGTASMGDGGPARRSPAGSMRAGEALGRRTSRVSRRGGAVPPWPWRTTATSSSPGSTIRRRPATGIRARKLRCRRQRR